MTNPDSSFKRIKDIKSYLYYQLPIQLIPMLPELLSLKNDSEYNWEGNKPDLTELTDPNPEALEILERIFKPGSMSLNQILRNPNGWIKKFRDAGSRPENWRKYRQYVSLIESLAQTTTAPSFLFRGSDLKLVENGKKGSVVSDLGFISTSYIPRVAFKSTFRKFECPVCYIIEVPVGSLLLDIDNTIRLHGKRDSHYFDHEAEIVLLPNTKLIVEDMSYIEGYPDPYLVRLKVLK